MAVRRVRSSSTASSQPRSWNQRMASSVGQSSVRSGASATQIRSMRLGEPRPPAPGARPAPPPPPRTAWRTPREGPSRDPQLRGELVGRLQQQEPHRLGVDLPPLPVGEGERGHGGLGVDGRRERDRLLPKQAGHHQVAGELAGQEVHHPRPGADARAPAPAPGPRSPRRAAACARAAAGSRRRPAGRAPSCSAAGERHRELEGQRPAPPAPGPPRRRPASRTAVSGPLEVTTSPRWWTPAARDLAEVVARPEAAQRQVLAGAASPRPPAIRKRCLPGVGVAVEPGARRDRDRLGPSAAGAPAGPASSRERRGLRASAAAAAARSWGRAATARSLRAATGGPVGPRRSAQVARAWSRASEHPQEEALQVAGLRHPQQHRVVAARTAPLQDLHVAARRRCAASSTSSSSIASGRW